MGCRQSLAAPDRPHSSPNGPGNLLKNKTEVVEIVDAANQLENFFEENPLPLDSELMISGCCNYPLIHLPNNSTYQGEWKDGKQCGVGKMIYENGGVYEGFWRDGQANGFGSYKAGTNSSMVGSSYSGMFNAGRANGYGVFKFADQSSYRGMFCNDRRHGIGMETHSDGLQYIGPYIMGKKRGIGRLKSPNDEYFIGEFSDNEISGYGVYRWPDGRTYEGYWVMSIQEGRAKHSWPDGRIYVGNYEKGKINDRGIITWPDGRRYDGQWKNGLQEGVGKYYKNRTQYRSAVFVEGVRTRWETDFITLPEEAPAPFHQAPNNLRDLDISSIYSMEMYLLNYLEARFNLREMKDNVDNGYLMDWQGTLVPL